jgi:hypothetical protein
MAVAIGRFARDMLLCCGSREPMLDFQSRDVKQAGIDTKLSRSVPSRPVL